VEGWNEDILTALRELEDIAAPRQLSLAGLRIGGLLAAKAAETQALENIILWEPVLSGQDYLQLLHSLNVHEHQNNKYRYFRARDIDSDADDLLGFSYPSLLRESLNGEFLSEKTIRARKVILVTSEDTTELNQIVISLKESGLQVDYVTTTEQGDWANPQFLNKAFILNQTLDIISKEIS
jgi:hypothetical protein